MTRYKFRFNIEGGDHIEFNLNKEQFERLSQLCEKEFPDRDWKTEEIPIQLEH